MLPKQGRCPECGGKTVLETREDTIEYKGHKRTIMTEALWCTECPEAVLQGEGLRKSEEAFLALRAEVEGVLGPKEVTAIRERLGLSQRKAGEILGGGPRSFYKYESGKQQVSVPMSNLLRILARHPEQLRELEER